MVPKLIVTISSILCLLYLGSINCHSHESLKPNPRQFENPMRDFNKCLSALSVNKKLSRDHCFSQLCTYVTGLFECKVLQCKNKFPGKNEGQKKSMVRCVKGVCGSRPSQSLCQGIQKCEGLKKGSKEEKEYKGCITKLFPEK